MNQEAPHNARTRALGMMPTSRSEMHARLIQDKGSRIRVGDVMSPVIPGDPAPGGGIYRAGQYAPHVDDLAIQTFSSAKTAGILPLDLPIFDENGDVDKDKLDAWNPNNEGLPVGFSDDIPVYSAAVLASTFKQVNPDLLENLNMNVFQAPRTPGDFGNYIVGVKTSGSNRQFSSQLFIYPDFFKFIDKPIVPKTPKRQSGLSVSSFMTFHAMGHILLSKLSFEGKLTDVSGFIDSSGWIKNLDSTHDKAWFMGRRSTSSWYKDSTHRFLSELSRYSPVDDFAQAFAFYHTNVEYLQKIDFKKYKIMHKIISEQL